MVWVSYLLLFNYMIKFIFTFHLVFIYLLLDPTEEQLQKIKENELLSPHILVFIIIYLKGIGTLDTDFVVVEPQLFSLSIKDALPIIYMQNANDEIKEKRKKMTDHIIDQLFNICLTLKEFPYIRYVNQKPSEDIAKAFHEKVYFFNYR